VPSKAGIDSTPHRTTTRYNPDALNMAAPIGNQLDALLAGIQNQLAQMQQAQQAQALAQALAQQQAQALAQQQIQAQLAQLLAAVNPVVLAAQAGDVVLARENNRRADPLEPVPVAGMAPANWPAAGLSRVAVRRGAIGLVDALLTDYGLLVAGSTDARRVALAHHLGYML
jgi:hypothetical protein